MKSLKPLLLLALLALPQAAQAQPPRPQASKMAQRLQAHLKHPQLAPQLLSHLRQAYPDLERRALRGLLKVQQDYPKLAYSLPRHLIEDLEGEPLQALLDIAQALQQRYPDFPQRLQALRQQQRPGVRVAQALLPKYSGLLKYLATHPSPLPRIRLTAQATMLEQFPQLRGQIRLEALQLVEKQYPGLLLELVTQRGRSQRLAYLMKHHPQFLPQLATQVQSRHGSQIRQALVATLQSLEDDPKAQWGSWLNDLVAEVDHNHPGLWSDFVSARSQTRTAFLQSLQQEFPELLPLVHQTLRDKHPQLLSKSWGSLSKHYPQLAQDLRQSLEAELPGLEQRVDEFWQRQPKS